MWKSADLRIPEVSSLSKSEENPKTQTKTTGLDMAKAPVDPTSHKGQDMGSGQ
jgi:hypothetical protein